MEPKLWLVERVMPRVGRYKREVFRFVVMATEHSEAIGYAMVHCNNKQDGEWFAMPTEDAVWSLRSVLRTDKECEVMANWFKRNG